MLMLMYNVDVNVNVNVNARQVPKENREEEVEGNVVFGWNLKSQNQDIAIFVYRSENRCKIQAKQLFSQRSRSIIKAEFSFYLPVILCRAFGIPASPAPKSCF